MKGKTKDKPFKEVHTFCIGVNVCGLPLYHSHILYGTNDQNKSKRITNVNGLTHL